VGILLLVVTLKVAAMADTVHYLMEQMVPELEDLERRGLFKKAEIKQIVKK
jgi:U3 small nucleolar RNA-associated protein 6